ncbi:hypothetical protein CUJ87_31615 (plasmid) [Paraburkholderia caledonica]|nr:hypothetical protein CUJ87_31615 [Paraburkholderia caledonica]
MLDAALHWNCAGFDRLAADSAEVIDTVVPPGSMAGPQAIKMLVTAEQNGTTGKSTGSTGVRGFVELSLPAANGRTPEFSVAVVTVGAAARTKRGQRLGIANG